VRTYRVLKLLYSRDRQSYIEPGSMVALAAEDAERLLARGVIEPAPEPAGKKKKKQKKEEGVGDGAG